MRRLRYLNLETGKWEVCKGFQIEEGDEEGDGFPRACGCFVASAAIHLANETECARFTAHQK